MYVGWMLQVRVTIQSCQLDYFKTIERLQKPPSIRAVKDAKVGKSRKINFTVVKALKEDCSPMIQSMSSIGHSQVVVIY
jgi:hypothetical protein